MCFQAFVWCVVLVIPDGVALHRVRVSLRLFFFFIPFNFNCPSFHFTRINMGNKSGLLVRPHTYERALVLPVCALVFVYFKSFHSALISLGKFTISSPVFFGVPGTTLSFAAADHDQYLDADGSTELLILIPPDETDTAQCGEADTSTMKVVEKDETMFFTSNRSSYPSTSSTTSVRADCSFLEEIQVLWSQSYVTDRDTTTDGLGGKKPGTRQKIPGFWKRLTILLKNAKKCNFVVII